MARVFVSHASEDRVLARDLRQWLRGQGYGVFLAEDLRDGIAVGEQWQRRLHEELRRADAVVCVVTSAYLTSRWCAAEVATAQARGSKLLPLRAELGVIDPLLDSVQDTGDYTRDQDGARAKLIEALLRVDAAGGLGWPDGRSPFPGLRPFDTEWHRVFFGRTREVEQLAGLLRSPAERAEGAALLVVGPSGCGKSSLVRAGLLHVMADEPDWWTLRPIMPGDDPVVALVRELAATARRMGLDWTVAQVRHQLDSGGLTELADELLLAAPGGPRRRLLVVVDQFEELLTQTAPAQQARFAELLRPALTGPVQLVATLRSEFLGELQGNAELATLSTHIYSLRSLRREGLRAAVTGPTKLAGIGVEDDLVARLVDDTDNGDALPLLAFTLAQLAEGIGRGGRLSSAHYDQLGGVRGALTRQADAALTAAVAAGGRGREEVIAGLLRLVTVDEQGLPTRWRAIRDELTDPVVAEQDAFVERRLLITDTDNGSVMVGVAHEAFLSAWPPLDQAITANASALRARRAVEQAAEEWNEKGRPPARLWERGQLAAAVADTGARIHAGSSGTAAPADLRKRGPSDWLPWRQRVLVTDRVDLSSKARGFLHASIRRDRFRRGRTTTILSVLLVLALTAAGVAIIQQQAAQEQQRIATARQLVAQADAARDTDPRTALLLGTAAQRIHADGETQASLVNTLTTTHYAGALTGNRGSVDSVAFAPDGHLLATGGSDGAIVWDLANPARPRRLEQSLTGSVNSVAFAPDGRTLAIGGGAGATLWDLADPARPHRLGQPFAGGTFGVGSIAFSLNGRVLVTDNQRFLGTDGGDGTILWDLTAPAQPRRLGYPLAGHSDGVFSPDGPILATRTTDGAVSLWDLTDPTRPQPRGQIPIDHSGGLNSVAFSPNGHTLATGSDDTAILWDLTNPAQPRRIGQPLRARVKSVAFSPDGNTLATGGDDGTAILWDLTDLARAHRIGQPLTSRSGSVSSVAFSPDGRTLATGKGDVTMGTVMLWDLAAQPRRLGRPLNSYNGGVFSGDGHILATNSDGSTTLWDLTDPAQPRRLGQPLNSQNGYVQFVAFPRVRRTLAIGSAGDGTIILWDLTDPARPRRLGRPFTSSADGVDSAVFSPDGRTLAVGNRDKTVILWDLGDPARPRRTGQLRTSQVGFLDSVVFSADGHILATGGAEGVSLWDFVDPAQPRLLGQPLNGHTEFVNSLALSRDGHILATGSGDDTAILWDLTDPAQPRRLGQPLTGHTDAVGSVVFSPDGRTLVTGDSDTAILWELTGLNSLREHATERACSITGGGLNRDEWARYIPGLPYQNTCPG